MVDFEKRRKMAEFAGYNITAYPGMTPDMEGMPRVMLTDSVLPVVDDGVCQEVPHFECDAAAACSLLPKLGDLNGRNEYDHSWLMERLGNLNTWGIEDTDQSICAHIYMAVCLVTKEAVEGEEQ